MPQCAKCGKESNNLRICPFCHAEYVQPQAQKATPRATFGVAQPSQPGGTARGSTAMPAPSPGFRGFTAGLSPAVKWGVPSVIVVFAVWFVFFGGERRIPVGVVMPNMVTLPMVPLEADAILRRTKETGKVEVIGSEVRVTFPKANFPEHRDGQLALAQQFARADEIVEGHKRVIAFYDANGGLFARADPSGVMMVR